MEITRKPIWETLQDYLKPGLEIRNWTALKGYLGDSMRIEEITDNEVVVKTPNAKNLQHVSSADIEKLWESWAAYNAGRVQRQEIRDMTFHSKYIISILHWLELDNK